MEIKDAASIAQQIERSRAFEEVKVLGTGEHPCVVAIKHKKFKHSSTGGRVLRVRNVWARLEKVRGGALHIVSPDKKRPPSRYAYIDYEQGSDRVIAFEHERMI